MRCAPRKSLIGVVLVALAAALLVACGGPPSGRVPVPGSEGGLKSAAIQRAERRAFDGAPPVVPHENFQIACTSCHNLVGMAVEGTGYAPASPHAGTLGMSAVSRCQQCHVFAQTDAVFAANRFAGLRQDLRHGERLGLASPPTIPHKVFMRENCAACHSGPAAREEVRTSHPERIRCRQCHVPVTTRATFEPGPFTRGNTP